MNKHIKTAEALTALLENKFKVGPYVFGLDPLLGLIPGVGDAISASLSLYIVWISKELKLPKNKINRMYLNIAVDFVIGLIPLVGDYSDFIFKSNTKNLKILKEHEL